MEGTKVTLPHMVQIKRAQSDTYYSIIQIDLSESAIFSVRHRSDKLVWRVIPGCQTSNMHLKAAVGILEIFHILGHPKFSGQLK